MLALISNFSQELVCIIFKKINWSDDEPLSPRELDGSNLHANEEHSVRDDAVSINLWLEACVSRVERKYWDADESIHELNLIE